MSSEGPVNTRHVISRDSCYNDAGAGGALHPASRYRPAATRYRSREKERERLTRRFTARLFFLVLSAVSPGFLRPRPQISSEKSSFIVPPASRKRKPESATPRPLSERANECLGCDFARAAAATARSLLLLRAETRDYPFTVPREILLTLWEKPTGGATECET